MWLLPVVSAWPIECVLCSYTTHKSDNEVQEANLLPPPPKNHLNEPGEKMTHLELEYHIMQSQMKIRELEEMVSLKDKQIQELRQRLRLKGVLPEDSAVLQSSIELSWRKHGEAPCRMHFGSSTVDGSIAYFRPAGSAKVYAYDSDKDEWSTLPQCPRYHFTLAVVNGLLTAVGGYQGGTHTNTLLSLVGEGEKWAEHFPPMPTKRSLSAAMCTKETLIVAGGRVGHKRVKNVEVMYTTNLQWFSASSLPHPSSQASLTICSDTLYLLGGVDSTGKWTKAVFSCPLAVLLHSCHPQSLAAWLKFLLVGVWHQQASTPMNASTCAVVQDQLLAIGGEVDIFKPTLTVHSYCPTTNTWDNVSHMRQARSACLVTPLPRNRLMVVGGNSEWGQTNAMDIAAVLHY